MCGNIDFADRSTYAVVPTTVVISMLGRAECHRFRPLSSPESSPTTSPPFSHHRFSGPILANRSFIRWRRYHLCDRRHRLYRLDSLSDPIGRCPLSSPPEPVGFRAEFQPATVAVAASDYSYTFKVVRATDPSHRPVLGRR